jgi:hypothetical protein
LEQTRTDVPDGRAQSRRSCLGVPIDGLANTALPAGAGREDPAEQIPVNDQGDDECQAHQRPDRPSDLRISRNHLCRRSSSLMSTMPEEYPRSSRCGVRRGRDESPAALIDGAHYGENRMPSSKPGALPSVL